jgi:phenylacetate-coenzyme A ligase PaaK-like adenylate-forming protein
MIFESSGTTEENTSKHYVADKNIYKTSFKKAFHHFYGDASNYVWLGLLPSYLERKNSSLVYMVDYFIRHSEHRESSFYLKNHDELYKTLIRCIEQQKPVILIGVSSALLDFTEKYQLPASSSLIVMETGGMKGAKKEIIRSELHETLKKAFYMDTIHSEYGMTELLSQAYSKKEGQFNTPPWMKILIRDVYDPFNVGLVNKNGGINCIDLANIYSCSFIETQDMGILHNDGSFEVLGRMDHTIARGCNTMI